MVKLSKGLLVAAYCTLLFFYLKMTLIARSKDSIEIEYVYRQSGVFKKILKDIKKYGVNATVKKLKLNFHRPERLPTDLKYVLKWTSSFTHFSSQVIPMGQTVFLENKCEFTNCFITSDKILLPDRRLFDVILFDETNWDDHPIIRDSYQYYIYTSSESASDHPVCESMYDSFYNLTWTYKLNSDMLWTHFDILDKTGKKVGPKVDMNWIETMDQAPENVVRRLGNKKKLAAWFVSNCRTISEREKLATKLSAVLAKYNLKIDIYGWCGDLTCPKDRMEDCMELLETNYYFYLAFESSLSEDYVSEKVLYPLQHYTVPVVYGGANYSRFLPPGSYLDAGKMNATELAMKMVEAMKKPVVYQQYFRWHNHYTYKKSTSVPDACSLCKMLNNPNRPQFVVKDFRKWWLPNYKKTCDEEEKRFQQRRRINDLFNN